MRGYQQNNWSSLKNSIIFNGFLMAAAVLAGWSSYKMVRRYLALRDESRQAGVQIEELAGRKKELEANLLELETSEALEREAKERFNLKRRGEEVVVVVPEKREEVRENKLRWWERIKKFFR